MQFKDFYKQLIKEEDTKADGIATDGISTHEIKIFSTEESRDLFKKNLDKLNTKCKEFGVAEVKILKEEKDVASYRDDNRYYRVNSSTGTKQSDIGYMYALDYITVQYPLIKIGDYEIVAVKNNEDHIYSYNIFDETFKNNNIVKTKVADTHIHCEHCDIKRQRNKSYILKNDKNGDIKEVGNSCLKNYTKLDPVLLLNSLEYILDYNDKSDSGGAAGIYFSDVVAITEGIIRTQGYVSKSTESLGKGKATTGEVYEMLFSNPKDAPDLVKTRNEYINKYKNFQEIRKHALEKNKDNTTDFGANMKTIMAGQSDNMIRFTTLRRILGFVAYAVSQYVKDVSVTSDTKSDVKKSSEHQGDIGEKITRSVVVSNIKPSQYNDMYSFKDSENNVYTTFGNYKLKIGDNVKITGDVKDHYVYNNYKSTTLSKVKITDAADDMSEDFKEKMVKECQKLYDADMKPRKTDLKIEFKNGINYITSKNTGGVVNIFDDSGLKYKIKNIISITEYDTYISILDFNNDSYNTLINSLDGSEIVKFKDKAKSGYKIAESDINHVKLPYITVWKKHDGELNGYVTTIVNNETKKYINIPYSDVSSIPIYPMLEVSETQYSSKKYTMFIDAVTLIPVVGNLDTITDYTLEYAGRESDSVLKFEDTKTNTIYTHEYDTKYKEVKGKE